MTVKVTIASDGVWTVTVETDDIAAAVTLINGLNGSGPYTGPMEDTTTAMAEFRKPRRKPRKKAARKADTSLSRQLSAVHERLVSLGEPTTPAVIADHLALAPATAGYRLKRLVEKGYATQVSHGKYQA